MRQCQQNIYHAVKQGHQEANQAILHKENTGYLPVITGQVHRSHRTDNHNPLGQKELGSWDSVLFFLQGPRPRTYLALSSIYLPDFRQGTKSLICTSWSQGKPWNRPAPNSNCIILATQTFQRGRKGESKAPYPSLEKECLSSQGYIKHVVFLALTLT